MVPQQNQRKEPIAIVGSGCRFPGGSSSPSKLWDLLREPRDCLLDIPQDRFSWEGYYRPGLTGAHHGASNTKHTYFLTDSIRKFDPHFFNIQPAEADALDPQQRLLLETVYESLETAGLTVEGLQGSDTAVYVGMMACDYNDVVQRDVDCAPTYAATGTARSIHSNRISYFFDWHGPSMTIDTACSSSMMAIHLAVQALRSGESRVAVACGASLIIGPENYIILSNLNMLAPDGRAKMWDASANGYARGEGVAAVALKTLSQAIADGDHIECIIRETAINQDGRTKGITMPSEIAQAKLIRRTYAQAGLDLRRREDRPQYFEAHGTGTPAGDPKEAEAVHNAFFGGEGAVFQEEDNIYIGSIKSVIGHTEGTAGIAGVLKASLALQSGFVPPNLLFNELNPDVAPFAKHLRVPTKLIPWPRTADDAPRRASVNSFGFGGSNGHAILESYDNSQHIKSAPQVAPVTTPFTFSAQSEKTLQSLLRAYLKHLQENPEIDLRDLAWTLQSRRSAFSVKSPVSALTTESLCSKISEKLESAQAKDGPPVGVKSSGASGKINILGVFTGQGAQWAQMGHELILASTQVQKLVSTLDDALATLPESDRPSWTISDELHKDAKVSRIGEAALSQPLCTAVQIVLVHLLRAAGINLTAVVGHSSGEIGAAFAAGFITATEAIRIAYYRGVYAKLAAGRAGQKGAMLAAGTSMEDAMEICALEEFEGRVSVAACNSAASVTLSGDRDAIEEVSLVFVEEKKFNRLLKVDTAYHSHHMQPCAQPYIQSLEACKIAPGGNATNTSPVWFSSVIGGKQMQPDDSIRATYWKDNMVQPVLFMQAIESAMEHCTYDLILEIGPHPALKSPALQTIQDVTGGSDIPYSGLLTRGQNDIVSMSTMLGFVWANLGPDAVDFSAFDKIMSESADNRRFLKNLPTYQWDHERSYWYESRISRAHRMRKGPIHDLLGVQYGESTETEVRWRNYLIPKEIEWLNDHRLQGQAVFPAAAYATMAWEAAASLAKDKSIRMIEIQDLHIGRPITFDDDGTGVEVNFALTNISHNQEAGGSMKADWACYSSPNKETGTLVLVGSGKIVLTFGSQSPNTLPSRGPTLPNMLDTDPDEFYRALMDLGYEYTGPFRAMTSLQRKLNHATGLFAMPPSDMLFHPASLDIALQSLFAALSHPGDGEWWSLHVPTSARRIRLNPYFCSSEDELGLELPFDTTLAETGTDETLGDVQIFSPDGKHAVIQVEGVSSVPFSGATAADDRNIFSKVVWDCAVPDGDALVRDHEATAQELAHGYDCERVAHYYLKRLHETITTTDFACAEWHHQKLVDWAAHIVAKVSSGQHTYASAEWVSDTQELIDEIISKYPGEVDFQIMKAVGESFPSVVRGESTPLEHLVKDNMLYDFYKDGLGFQMANSWTAGMIKQISHRYPHMHIMEIGAGTGGATETILNALESDFASYTYTDISPAFFERAQEKFKMFSKRMTFKTFDMEKTVEAQGFSEGSFDLVVASNVLHATKDLDTIIRRTRSLLKPGGYLVLLEITDNDQTRMGFTMGGLPGWWVGHDTGRRWAPTLRPAQWNNLLQRTGFSRIDAIASPKDRLVYPFSVIATQATDDRFDTLLKPLLSAPQEPMGHLMIVGGKTLLSSRMIGDAVRCLKERFDSINIFEGLEDVPINEAVAANILSLADLDEPIFREMTAEKLQVIKAIARDAKNVVWATKGCLCDDPYANMTVGLARSLSCECKDLRMQIVDSELWQRSDISELCEALLRLCLTGSWETQGMFDKVLWSTEPEMLLQQGRMFIPRMYMDKERNLRYNSKRRLITAETALSSSKVHVSYTGSNLSLREGQAVQLTPLRTTETLITLRTICSLVSRIRLGKSGYFYLSVGHETSTGYTAFVLSDTNASILEVPPEAVFPCIIEPGEEQGALISLAMTIVVHTVVDIAEVGSTILFYGEEPQWFDRVQETALKQGKFAIQLTNDEEVNEACHIYVHQHDFEHKIRELLPANVSVFLNLSQDTSYEHFTTRVASVLPKNSILEELGDFFSHSGTAYASFARLGMDRVDLEAYCIRSSKTAAKSLSLAQDRTLRLRDVPGAQPKGYLDILDWTADKTVPVKIEPIGSKISFKADRTYLLVGLTADLGQSLCEWFVRHGARYVVLTSRNPKVDEGWLKGLQKLGATVKVFSMDIIDKASLKATCDEISRILPPIAGVANAAMVLQDIMFSNMEFENLVPVLRPKVEGSKNLDELFSENTLDFFIMFSSLGLIVGNSGQSSYTAANAFMASLAANRRKRGLAGSVMDIGAIIGVGYISRAGQLTHTDISAYGAFALSESDMHQTVAETILASPADSCLGYEIVSGLRPIDPVVDDRVLWRENPRFAHFWIQEEENAGAGSHKRSALSAKAQLADVTSAAKARDVIEELFSARIVALLQLPPEDLDVNAPLTDLGVDSLVAVEIRSWFTKELTIDVPVLKVLGGACVSTLVKDALEKLPLTIAPKLVKGTADEEKQAGLKPAKNAEARSPVSTRPRPASEVSIKENGGNEERSSSGSSGSSFEDQDQETSSDSLEYETPLTPPSGPASEVNYFKRMVLKTQRMSYTQERFWFLTGSLQDQTALNITFSHHLKGDPHVAELERAVRLLGRLHEGLRTCFFEQDDIPMQGIMVTSPLHLEHRHITSEKEAELEYKRLANHVYDLQNGEAMKIVLLSLTPVSSYLIVGYHHIAMDGAGFGGFLRELMETLARKPATPPIQHPEFSANQRKQVETGAFKKELVFWKEKLRDLPEPLPLLPFSNLSGKIRPARPSYEFSTANFRIESNLMARIKMRARRLQSTAFHFCLAALKIMLLRLLDNDLDDLCIGIAHSNRDDAELQRVMGPLVNLVPLRFKTKARGTFVEAVKDARKTAHAALSNASVPFNELLNALNIERFESHSPIFQAFMDYRQGVQERLTLGECEVQRVNWSYGKNGYDINLDIMENAGGDGFITFNLQQSLYSPEEANMLMKIYVNLLESFSRNTALHVNEVELFSSADIETAVNIGRGPYMKLQWPSTVVDCVDQVVRTNAASLAIKDDQSELTYDQMAKVSNKIAAALVDAGIQKGDRVVCYQQPTADLVCSMLAIMRVGATFVPLDLRNPMPRLVAVVKDCQPSAILTQNATARVAKAFGSEGGKHINISSLKAFSDSGPVDSSASAEGIAVILYTSGSTGIPKGVRLSHENLRSNIEGMTGQLNIGQERVLQQSAMSFDMATGEMLLALLNGGSLHVVPQAARGDTVKLTQIIKEENITLTLATPTEYSSWLRFGGENLKEADDWKIAFSGGERVTSKLQHEFQSLGNRELRLINTYGPCEAFVAATSVELPYRSQPLEDPHVGFALPNYSVHILDRSLKPVPVGMVGEICIGGAAIAKGYLNNPELTQEKFVQNPFAPPEWKSKGWITLYRTGDQGRWRSDGALFFEGRINGDSQVKLNGIRIELEEIENAISTTAGDAISQAVVSVRGDPAYLIAHAIPSGIIDEGFLEQIRVSLPLPPYMIPTMILPVDSFPITNHNKVDRKAIGKLPLPQDLNAGRSSTELTSHERRLAELWGSILSQDLLNARGLHPNTDFFTVGGNSILLIRLQSLIRKEFQVAIPLASLVGATSLSRMADSIVNATRLDFIDWNEEADLSKEAVIPRPINISLPPRKLNGIHVLFTGATGYLGRHILQQLVKDARVSRVSCVAVRQHDDDSRSPRSPPVISDKVTSFPGDLCQYRLGLSEEAFDTLASTVDVIIHSAANRSFWDNYHTLRSTNVVSTKVLVGLASQRHIPIHFLSSGAVIRLGEENEDDSNSNSGGIPVGPASTEPPKDGSDGYVSTKWAAEKALERAASELKVPVHVHRIMPAPKEARISTDDVFAEFLRIVKLKGIYVSKDSIKGHIDLVETSKLATDISKHVLNAYEDEGTDMVRYVHHGADVRIEMEEWKDWQTYVEDHFEDLDDILVQTVHGMDWMGIAKDNGFPYLVASQEFDVAGVSSSVPIYQRR